VSELTDIWSEHLGESPFTDLTVDALAGRELTPVDVNDFATNVAAEIVVVQQHILAMCKAIEGVTL